MVTLLWLIHRDFRNLRELTRRRPFFALLATGGVDGDRVHLAATAVSSCEASAVLEQPLGRSGKKLLDQQKIEPTSMRGASDDLPRVSIHGAICMYVGVAGRRVVMW